MAAWSIIGKDITITILKFLRTTKVLKQLNATNIALIPKVSVPDYANQLWPIAYRNVLYKVISKMICDIIKSVIQHIVADNQSAFVQGRSMLHYVLICHDILRHYNRRTSPRYLMKIDLKKAYYMVS